jgi:hypothetical protein
VSEIKAATKAVTGNIMFIGIEARAQKRIQQGCEDKIIE